MPDAIQLLERLACDSRPSAADDYAAALASLAPITRAALEHRDPVALARALGHPVTFACMIALPDQDGTEPEVQPDGQEVPDGTEESDEPAGRPD